MTPITANTAPCKVCGATAPLCGVVDFHKNCEQHRNPVLGLSGIPIYYHRCPQCRFIFTIAFDGFSNEDFHKHIYNDQYVLVDPDYVEIRPRGNAQLVQSIFPNLKPENLLDYGGGNGLLAAQLRASGFAAETYDPFVPQFATRPSARFDCVVSFEVAEHSPDPMRTFGEMNDLLANPGLIVFSTLVQPENIDKIGLNWWYAGPRNGHVSLYSRQSLEVIARKFGLKFGSFNDNLHILFREIPECAKGTIRLN